MKPLLSTIFLQPFYNLLMFLVFLLPGNSLGLAIILLTTAVRLAILPLTKTLTRQQALMAKLKPQIDGLKEKYKDDPARLSQETLSFYKKHHVNPAGSCLPLIIQLIVFVALYYALRKGVTADRFDLLYSFVPQPASVNPHFLGLDLSKPDLWVLPILAGLTQFIQSYQMIAKPKKVAGQKGLVWWPFGTHEGGPPIAPIKENDPSLMIQKQMTFIFPFLTVVVARTFPAALPLYWIVSSLISIAQQTFILKQTANISTTEADQILEADAAGDDIVEVASKKGVEVTVRRKSHK